MIRTYLYRVDIVRLLLDGGAKADAVNEFGKTPLQYAEELGKTPLGKTREIVSLMTESKNPSSNNEVTRANPSHELQSPVTVATAVVVADYRPQQVEDQSSSPRFEKEVQSAVQMEGQNRKVSRGRNERGM